MANTQRAAGLVGWCDETRCALAGCDPVICNGRAIGSNDEIMARSQAVIPGGVNSSIRAFASVGGRPYVVSRASGAEIWDVEGTRYLDLVQSYGAVILGHAHPDVTAAIAAAAGDGTSYGAPTPREMRLAEQIRDAVTSCEQVRFMNSGTEATSTAVRLARGYTGRDLIVTFHGNFHGATDALLAAGGSGVVAVWGRSGLCFIGSGKVLPTQRKKNTHGPQSFPRPPRGPAPRWPRPARRCCSGWAWYPAGNAAPGGLPRGRRGTCVGRGGRLGGRRGGVGKQASNYHSSQLQKLS